ncbi:MAG: TCR/Tet family MFS transporter [Bauldia sp.]|nr:TCR/Tet family MFS transporter [Bauldia sp.]
MNRPLIVIYSAIALDAVGIGLVFPILPSLLEDVTHAANVAPFIGAMIALYAVMQFIFAPVLGALSDRLGRRPVLLASLAGAAVNYLLLAIAPSLWLLLLARAIAGLAGANVSVASAYITDITPEESRARRFGLMNAMFGLGFIVGPVLGGVLGDHWLRLPFVAAAALNTGNLLLAALVLPESRAPSRMPVDLAALYPLRPLGAMLSVRSLRPIIVVFFLFSATGEAYGTCWALWGKDAFDWSGFMIGLSLGTFGALQASAQAFLPGPAVRRFGERATVLIGIAGATIALTVMAFAAAGWMVFAIMPVFVLGGIGVPALQSLATRQVDASGQGELQGVLAATVSLASIVAPLAFSSLYFVVRDHWPGAIWLSVGMVYALAAPMVRRLRLKARAAAP